jgi:lysophospholipase L1-like esterase
MKKSLASIGSLLLPCLVFASVSVQAKGFSKKDPFVYAVIGDSITRGVWADTSLESPNNRFYIDLVRAQLLREAIKSKKPGEDASQDPRDAITNSLEFIARDRLSAFIGTRDYSLPSRLKKKLGREVLVVNNAVLAGTYVDGQRQLDSLDERLKKIKKAPDLILVHINAVDFVREYTVAQFSHSTREFFIRLARSYPDSKIVVTQLVDVVALVTREDVPAYKLPRSDEMATCADMYSALQFGTLIGLEAGASADIVAQGYERLGAMREAIAMEVVKMANGQDEYGDFRGKVLLIDKAVAPPDGDFNPILAADCVHPNIAGHKLFGGILWDEMVAAGILD